MSLTKQTEATRALAVQGGEKMEMTFSELEDLIVFLDPVFSKFLNNVEDNFVEVSEEQYAAICKMEHFSVTLTFDCDDEDMLKRFTVLFPKSYSKTERHNLWADKVLTGERAFISIPREELNYWLLVYNKLMAANNFVTEAWNELEKSSAERRRLMKAVSEWHVKIGKNKNDP